MTLMEKIQQEAAQGGYRLISTDELYVKFRGADNILLVDVREPAAFEKGRIQGACNFSLKPTWWTRLTKKSALKALLGKDPQLTVVFY